MSNQAVTTKKSKTSVEQLTDIDTVPISLGKKIAKAKKTNSKQVIIEPEIAQDLAKTETYRNGIPENKLCTFSHQEMDRLYYSIKGSIEEKEYNLKMIKVRTADKGDDGRNGFDGNNCNANPCLDADIIIRNAQEDRKLVELMAVSNRIAKGLFDNTCDKCGGDISLPRLLMVPTTTLCQECNQT